MGIPKHQYACLAIHSSDSGLPAAEADLSFSASKELGVDLEKINVELKPKSKFWEAEAYHQDFANRNELKYKFYRFSCGRDQKLDKLWKENARSINVWSE